jgi:hypothetical protein
MAKHRSILSLTDEEIKGGEWVNDPELVAEFKQLTTTVSAAIANVIAEMSEEDQKRLKESLEDGTYSYGKDLIRAEGEM